MKEKYLSVREQINSLGCEINPISRKWPEFLETIDRTDLSEQINKKNPYVYFSAEYGCPGLGANGGLGMLSRDHFLQAADIGLPGYFLGLAYSSRKEQQIIRCENSNYYQYDEEKQLPSPQEIGMERFDQVNVCIKDFNNQVQSPEVYQYGLSTDSTKLLLLKVSGEVYPKEPNSDERLWNNVVMGMGGFQVIQQLQEKGLIEEPSVIHLNESATVLSALSFLDYKTQIYGNNYDAYLKALAELRGKTILTNHTLVPAAEASFNRGQCNLIFNNLQSSEAKIQLETFINQRGGMLKFLDLAKYMSEKCNGVSQFHSDEATRIFRQCYGDIYYGIKTNFDSVTNGIYQKGWNPEMFKFLEKHQVIDKFGIPNLTSFEENIDKINPKEFHNLKSKAVADLREYLLEGKRLDQFGNIVQLLDNAVIIGDARRVADYKRRWMIFKYPDRLQNILTSNPNVHIFISGKAHPADGIAKDQLSFVLKSIAENDVFRNQIHYLPDWDTELAKKLGPACHVWTNTPRVGEEACATSGMKTGFGGALQVSTVDGFYAELPKTSYYAIEGNTNSAEEFENYYSQLEHSIKVSQDPEKHFDEVKTLWKGGLLNIVSGARMVEDYINMAFPPENNLFVFQRCNLESVV